MASSDTPTPRQKSALLWGVVGGLCFLVFHQAYLLLLDGDFLGVVPVGGVAVAVFAATTVASYYLSGRFDRRGAGDGEDEWVWGGGEATEESPEEERPRDGSE